MYDITPIKMVEEGIKSPSTATKGIVQQDDGKSQEKFSNHNFIEQTYNALSSAKNENGTRPKSEESRYVLNELKSDLDELHTLWESALWDARENALWAEKTPPMRVM